MKYRELFTFSKKEVDAAFSGAKRAASIQGLKMLRASLPENQKTGKLLVVTPKKSGNAPKRNQLRRRLRAIFYEEKLFEVPRISIIIAYTGAMRLSYDELKSFLIQNIKR